MIMTMMKLIMVTITINLYYDDYANSSNNYNRNGLYDYDNEDYESNDRPYQ
jgi:hypothetical protein